MPRIYTQQTLHAMFSRQTNNGPILLLSLTPAVIYPGGPQPPNSAIIRVSSDCPPGWSSGVSQGTVSRGNLFVPFPFAVALTDADPDTMPSAKLQIDNIDRSILAALQAIAPTPMTVLIEMVTFALPGTVDWTSGWLTLRSVQADVMTIQGDLRLEELLNEPALGDVVSPSTDPGTFLIQ
jgi:hypothetical protein